MLPFGVNFANAELSTIREVSTNANTDLETKELTMACQVWNDPARYVFM